MLCSNATEKMQIMKSNYGKQQKQRHKHSLHKCVMMQLPLQPVCQDAAAGEAADEAAPGASCKTPAGVAVDANKDPKQ